MHIRITFSLNYQKYIYIYIQVILPNINVYLDRTFKEKQNEINFTKEKWGPFARDTYMHVFKYIIDSTIISFIKKKYITFVTKLSKKVDIKKRSNLKELSIQLRIY